jgi:hypothetical protein
MKARFLSIVAEGRWIDGAALSLGFAIGWLLFA